MKKQLSLFFTILVSNLIYSQTEYVEKYENGQIKIQGFLIDSVLTGRYTEYYKNEQIKTTGEFKNCEYETNHTKIYIAGCGVGNNSTIRKGKKHGEWKVYSENGILKSKSNYVCGLRQGIFFYYGENGKLSWIDFYHADKEIETQEFFENGLLEKITTYSYEYSVHDKRDLKRTIETEYYKDGSLKIQRVIQELKDDIEKESFKEYYPNGFLKTESEIIDLDKNGIYREFYENGNTKFEGIFKDDKPIGKQYFFNSKGEIIKIETWKDGKIIKTEIKKSSG
ncbi:toxin-antitoxin system YwqK family antitoxin [Tenacibaculum jejuense]|uniref:Exported 24-amino acid repeat protein n=1 Tax=Tenacibaculum jejuense TaxID=584609 RepID=A0A238U681_9FLAO|nr:hypothetical protein [Tenacibaculum jejuense]SNR14721.1 conserved protein of unknown function [Tenacibaculum jejuense]